MLSLPLRLNSQHHQDKPLTIYGDGSQTRSFQFVSDLVNGLHTLMVSSPLRFLAFLGFDVLVNDLNRSLSFYSHQNGQYDLPVNLGNPDEYTVKHFAEVSLLDYACLQALLH